MMAIMLAAKRNISWLTDSVGQCCRTAKGVFCRVITETDKFGAIFQC